MISALLFFLACGTGTGDRVAPPDRPSLRTNVQMVTVPTEAVRPSDAEDPLTPVLQAIYDAAECLGPFARVQVFRGPEKEVRALLYHPDPGRCSHGPSVYFGPDGAVREVVEMKPVTRENLADVEALHARNRQGGTLAETRTFR